MLALTLPNSAHLEAPHTRAWRLGMTRHGATPTYDSLAPMLEQRERGLEQLAAQPHKLAEPGAWGVVEAGCVHDDRRRYWVHHPDGNWWPAVSYSDVKDQERPIMPDDWDSLIEPAIVRAGIA